MIQSEVAGRDPEGCLPHAHVSIPQQRGTSRFPSACRRGGRAWCFPCCCQLEVWPQMGLIYLWGSLSSFSSKTRKVVRWIEKGGKRKIGKCFPWSVRPESQQGENWLPLMTKNAEAISQLLLPNSSGLFGTSLFSPFSSTERTSCMHRRCVDDVCRGRHSCDINLSSS